MLGQAIVAAGRHAPDRRVVSANMVFLRPADSSRPLRFELSELTAGRAFSTVVVQVLQQDRLCAAGTLLLGVVAPEVIRHSAEPPDVPGPYDSPPYDMGVTGRDVRIVDGAYVNDSEAPVGPPTLDAWVRFREVPDDPVLQAGLLAEFTGHMSIAAALRPHKGIGQDQAHRTLSMGINAISLSLHREVHADHWLLYHHLSTFAGDGLTHSECRVHDEAGELIASFTVDAMIRPFPGSTTDKLDERTALMSLTTGKGPLSARPAGRFTVPIPEHVAYVEPFRRRVRATKDGRTVIDSERVLLVHRQGRPPTYAFPTGDVEGTPTEPEPEATGYVTVPWNAVDSWFEEDEQVFGHPRNPYHRVDYLRSVAPTPRRDQRQPRWSTPTRRWRYTKPLSSPVCT